MTIGDASYDTSTLNVRSGSWIGTQQSASWSGEDRPVSPRVPATYFEIHREVTRNGVTRVNTIRIRRPGYRLKRLKSMDPHPFVKSILRLRQDPVVYGVNGYLLPDMWCHSLPGWSNLVPIDSNDQIKLVNKLSEALKGSDFNASVFLGESRMTLKMLADSAIRIAKAIRHVMKLDVIGAARALFEGTTRVPLKRHDWKEHRPGVGSAKNASSLWLELQYGWLPLLKDVEGCAQSLAHYMGAPFQQTIRVSIKKENKETFITNGGSPYAIDTTVYRKSRRGLIALISEKPTVLATLGLLDPELVAWELMPFSFVSDWFIPIGSWMEARAAASRLTGTFITTDKREAYVDAGSLPTYGYYYKLDFQRSISSSLRVPMPEFKSFEKVASWRHCANALALVTQSFSSKRS